MEQSERALLQRLFPDVAVEAASYPSWVDQFEIQASQAIENSKNQVCNAAVQSGGSAEWGQCRVWVVQSVGSAEWGQCRVGAVQSVGSAEWGQCRVGAVQSGGSAEWGQCRVGAVQSVGRIVPAPLLSAVCGYPLSFNFVHLYPPPSLPLTPSLSSPLLSSLPPSLPQLSSLTERVEELQKTIQEAEHFRETLETTVSSSLTVPLSAWTAPNSRSVDLPSSLPTPIHVVAMWLPCGQGTCSWKVIRMALGLVPGGVYVYGYLESHSTLKHW